MKFDFNIVEKRKTWYLISGITVIAAIVSVALFGLNYGLDFTGGSLIELHFADVRPDAASIETEFSKFEINNVRIQPSGDTDYIIRLDTISEETHQLIVDDFKTTLVENPDNLTENRFESFGPSLGAELKQSALYAIIFVLIAIIIYVAYAFRKVSKPVASWKFGTVAVAALMHDTIVIVGLFAILGKLFNTEIDSFFVTALLTLLGFSVHDTIVTLDRVRENLIKMKDSPFATIVNSSINQTLTRSLNTSLTTLFTLLAIYFFGGASIKDLSLALIAGIIVGTYSSIFIAAPLLVTSQKFGKNT